MKNFFAFSYSSIYLYINFLTFFLCYAVVNLPFFPSPTGLGCGLLRLFNPLWDLVGSNGLGPSTSRLSGVCSNQLSYEPICGGGNRVRTDDPLLAGQVLYQLSYTPISFLRSSQNNCPPFSREARLLKTNKKETGNSHFD